MFHERYYRIPVAFLLLSVHSDVKQNGPTCYIGIIFSFRKASSIREAHNWKNTTWNIFETNKQSHEYIAVVMTHLFCFGYAHMSLKTNNTQPNGEQTI